jgi:hypothetical protein
MLILILILILVFGGGFSYHRYGYSRYGNTELQQKLTAEINAREDQVLFVELGPATSRGERVKRVSLYASRTRTSD